MRVGVQYLIVVYVNSYLKYKYATNNLITQVYQVRLHSPYNRGYTEWTQIVVRSSVLKHPYTTKSRCIPIVSECTRDNVHQQENLPNLGLLQAIRSCYMSSVYILANNVKHGCYWSICILMYFIYSVFICSLSMLPSLNIGLHNGDNSEQARETELDR